MAQNKNPRSGVSEATKLETFVTERLFRIDGKKINPGSWVEADVAPVHTIAQSNF